MNRWKKIGMLVLVVLCFAFIAGCSPQPTPTPTTPTATLGSGLLWQIFQGKAPLTALLPGFQLNSGMIWIFLLGGILVITKFLNRDLTFVIPYIVTALTWLLSAGKPKADTVSNASVLDMLKDLLKVQAQNQAQIIEVLNRTTPSGQALTAAPSIAVSSSVPLASQS